MTDVLQREYREEYSNARQLLAEGNAPEVVRARLVDTQKARAKELWAQDEVGKEAYLAAFVVRGFAREDAIAGNPENPELESILELSPDYYEDFDEPAED
jgi:hypothetical protein